MTILSSLSIKIDVKARGRASAAASSKRTQESISLLSSEEDISDDLEFLDKSISYGKIPITNPYLF
eukprot:Awhi_evm1s885